MYINADNVCCEIRHGGGLLIANVLIVRFVECCD